MRTQVILVDEQDQEVGVADKLAAHREGKLHRAFSIFIFNRRGEMLLQKRSLNKYHSGGLWSNACCSHPQPGESITVATARRLQEELGINCRLKKLFDFIYLARMSNKLIEHEFDHVYVGRYRGAVNPNPEEVMEYRWISPEDLKHELLRNPKSFTIWFKIAVEKLFQMKYSRTIGELFPDRGIWE
ncbi:MAG TPA: isopentenyl-diphosphate Delta-isomerase [bacterium]